jgi:Tol biopolymer transport system component
LVASGPGQDYYPDWSPDGRRIGFISAEAQSDVGRYFVTVRHDDGSWGAPRVQTTDSLSINSAPVWSPDRQLIAFANSRGEVVVSAQDGRGSRVIETARQLGGDALAVQWGGDPTIVFATAVLANGMFRIWAIPVAGGSPRLILSEDAAHRLGRANFITDGKRLFFTLAAWDSDVWVMDLKR